MKEFALIMIGFVVGSLATYTALQFTPKTNYNIEKPQGRVLLKAV